MIQKYYDFTAGAAKAKRMSDDELEFAIKDCCAARDAMKGWNPVMEGYYQDEASTYGMEVYQRRLLKKAKAEWHPEVVN